MSITPRRNTDEHPCPWVKYETVMGSEGPMGPTGATGPSGSQGDPGISGEPGEQGIQGIQGNIGLQGDPGISGEPGERGLQGDPGISGEPGEVGLQGPEGPEGPQGELGPSGESCYDTLDDVCARGNETQYDIHTSGDLYVDLSGSFGTDLFVHNNLLVDNWLYLNFVCRRFFLTSHKPKQHNKRQSKYS